MSIPIQARMTSDIALFYAIWLLIHVQISMMVSSISLSNSGLLTAMLCFVVILVYYNVRHIHMISWSTFFTFASREFGNLLIAQCQLSYPDG